MAFKSKKSSSNEWLWREILLIEVEDGITLSFVDLHINHQNTLNKNHLTKRLFDKLLYLDQLKSKL